MNIFINENSHGTAPNKLRTVIRDTNDTLDNSALEFDINSIIGDGNWHTYTLTVAAGVGSKVYLDGVLKNADTRGGDAFNPTTNLYFGARQDLDLDRLYGGLLDSVQVFSRALSSKDVSDVHTGGRALGMVDITVSGVVEVTTVSDVSDGDTASLAALLGDQGSDGLISLREAIEAANLTAGTDTITFNISGIGPHTIVPGSTLPSITSPVVIDGTTEPDFAGTPVIELDGSLAGAVSGLRLVAGSDGSTIRGLVINRFGNDGIDFDNTDNNLIAGNYIGTDVSGTADLGNADRGIHVRNGSSNNTIGGTNASDRNVIAGNAVHAIDLAHAGTDNNMIQGNYLGVDATGAVALGNDFDGVKVQLGASGNIIGGTAAGAANVIGANRYGVFIQGSGTSNNMVQGNYIGTDATGMIDLGHAANGIFLSDGATANTIGGTSVNAGNTIAFNVLNGIGTHHASTIGNPFYRNRIYQNNLHGIDLDSAGITANDVGDIDTGSNNLQNYPVLNSAHTTGTLTAISGSLNSIASTTFRLEYFANAAADGSGHGEGERYLGFREVTTHSTTGNARFAFMLSGAVTAGEFITATATNLSTNDTSEFALNVVVAAGLDSDSDSVLDIAEDRDLDADGNPATGPPLDTDGDTILDYLDTDDDGDGLATASEDANGNGDPTDDDADGDGIPDYLDFDGNGPGAGDSDGDLFDDDVECPSGIPCTDTDGDGIPNYMDPDHNTLVKRFDLEAMVSDDGVSLRWTTGWEVDNVGFRVYREVDGERVPLSSLVLGSAFLVGTHVALPAGHVYTWSDVTGTERDVYWIADTSLDASTTWHGPFQPELAFASETIPASTPIPALTGGDVFRKSSALSPSFPSPPDAFLRVMAPDRPRRWEQAGLSPQALQHVLAETPAIVIHIQKPGWYRVSQSELVEAGLDPAIDPRHLQLFVQGQAHAMTVIGEGDGRFDPQDAITFYGQGIDTPWSETQPYWLVVGARLGTRISTSAELTGPKAGTSFLDTLIQRERKFYSPAIQNGEAENFFGAVINSATTTQMLEMGPLDLTSPSAAQLTIRLQGATPGPHQVQVTLNQIPLGVVTFMGKNNVMQTFPLVSHQIQSGLNTLNLSALGEGMDISFLDTLELTYRRTYQALDDQIHAIAPEHHQVTLTGFSRPTIRVLDLTDPHNVESLQGDIQEQNGSYAITVTPLGDGARTLVAFPQDQHQKPLALSNHSPSTWHRGGHGAQVVMLSHGMFLESLDSLQALRESQGFSVIRLDVQDLYDAYTYGVKSPHALKHFLKHAQSAWQPAPRFVLFVGDASFDPRNYLDLGEHDWLPTYWTSTTQLETASDVWFVDFDNDGVGELALGRLPVRSVDEVKRLMAKFVSHDQNPPPLKGKALVITDAPDDFSFDTASEPLIRTLSESLSVNRLRLEAVSPAQASETLREQLLAGPLIVSYLGHGALDRWAPGGFITTADARALKAGPQLPIVLSMTCLNGFFQDPVTESLAEALLRSAEGGAIAVWASSGLTVAREQVPMQQALVEQLMASNQATLGEAMIEAQRAAQDLDVRRTWHLFGDPTIRLRK